MLPLSSQPQPPLRWEPKTCSSRAWSELLPAPALISTASRPRGSRTPSCCCSVAAGQGCTCVSHKHGRAGRSRCRNGMRGSVGGVPGAPACPPPVAQTEEKSFDLISLLYHTNLHGHISVCTWRSRPRGFRCWRDFGGREGVTVWQRQRCDPASVPSPRPVPPWSPPREHSRGCQQRPRGTD